MTSQSNQRRLIHQGAVIDLQIIRSKRKSLALHVFAEKESIELRAPLKCAWSQIEAFITERLDWMVAAVQHFETQPGIKRAGYRPGESHQFLGQFYPLSIHKGPGSVQIRGSRLQVQCQSPENEDSVRKQLLKFYRARAETIFPERLAACLKQFPGPQRPGGLRMRKMRARWGSCSSTGEICLNTLLVQKPQIAIDMVIIHELCHLQHFNHTRAFYRLMDEAMPNWRSYEKLLLDNPQSPTQLALF